MQDIVQYCMSVITSRLDDNISVQNTSTTKLFLICIADDLDLHNHGWKLIYDLLVVLDRRGMQWLGVSL